MNTGIADGYDIASRLAGVIADGQDEGVLDGYDSVRRAAALEVLAFTDRVTKMALLRNGAARRLRNAAIRVGSRFPPAQRTMIMWISGLKRSPLAEDQTEHLPR